MRSLVSSPIVRPRSLPTRIWKMVSRRGKIRKIWESCTDADSCGEQTKHPTSKAGSQKRIWSEWWSSALPEMWVTTWRRWNNTFNNTQYNNNKQHYNNNYQMRKLTNQFDQFLAVQKQMKKWGHTVSVEQLQSMERPEPLRFFVTQTELEKIQQDVFGTQIKLPTPDFVFIDSITLSSG